MTPEGQHPNPLIRHAAAFADALGVENAPVVLGLAFAPWESDEQRDQFIGYLTGRDARPVEGPQVPPPTERFPMPQMDGNKYDGRDGKFMPGPKQDTSAEDTWQTIPSPPNTRRGRGSRDGLVDA